MICAIDIGNTMTKVFLIDEYLNILETKTWPTPDLFETDRWKVFFEELYSQNSLFETAELRISCVSWQSFLSLRVFLNYDRSENFDIHRNFDVGLFELPEDTPIILEAHIPLDRSLVSGMIGTDRLLACYAACEIYKESIFVISLGTATTIDFVTKEGLFYNGVICPGIDSSYQGLLYRVPHLPRISELLETKTLFNRDLEHALYAGIYLSQALMIEAVYLNQKKELNLFNESDTDLILTGGRAFTISSCMNMKHKVQENLVALGIALLPSWIKKRENNIINSIDDTAIGEI